MKLLLLVLLCIAWVESGKSAVVGRRTSSGYDGGTVHSIGMVGNMPGLSVWNTRRTQCEELQCPVANHDDDPNCLLRCMSANCFQEIYGANELEPGEIDADRRKQFASCLRAEMKE